MVFSETTRLNPGRYRAAGLVLSIACAAPVLFAAAPGNDNFNNRFALGGSSTIIRATNLAATEEVGEPNHGGNAGGKSVWWSWTAPFSGGASLTTAGSDFNTLLAVYTGNTLAGLVPVAGDARTNVPAVVSFRATAGVNYKIAVDGWNGASGEILLSLMLHNSPPNDNFANRVAIGSGTNVLAQNFGATREAGETNHAGVIGGRSLWWTWTAAASGCVAVTTSGSDFDTILGVYTNNALSNLTAVAVNDDRGKDVAGTVYFEAIAGRAYQIAVDGYNLSAGTIVLSVLPLVPPANDDFADRATLSGTNQIITSANFCATKEAGEPNHNGNPGGKSMWWQWQAPQTGGAVIDLAGSAFPTELAVYTGNAVGSLTPVAGGTDHVVFRATNGTNYRIAVDGLQLANGEAQSGSIRLHLAFNPSPTNDFFANRLPLTLVPTNGNNFGATSEPQEPSHSLGIIPRPTTWGRSVWWTWTAPSNGPATITTSSSNFVSVLAIYTGTNLAALTRVAARAGINSTNEVILRATAGTTYHIAVEGANGAAGFFTLRATMLGLPGNNDFSKRIALSGTNLYTNGWNVNASRETGEPVHFGVTGSNSVWWSWATQSSGRLFLSTIGSTFSPVLALYQGTQVNTLSPLTGSYGGPQCPHFSALAWDVIVPTNCGSPPCSQTYQIAVDAPNGQAGAVNLGLIFVPRPTNDNFAAPTALTGSFLTLTSSVIAATMETGENIAGATNGLRTVWYSWTAPTNLGAGTGWVTLRVTGVNFAGAETAPRVGVFQGNSLGSLVSIGTDSELNGNIRQVTFQAAAGAAYRIAVGCSDNTGAGYDNSFAQRRGALLPNPLAETGTFVLHLNFSPLALKLTHVIPAELGLTDRGIKVPFGVEAQILNYGPEVSRPVRVRLIGLASDGSTFGNLGTFNPLLSNTVPAATMMSVGIGAACPPLAAVLAILEEDVAGNWFFRDSSIAIVGLNTVQNFLCFTVTGGGVVLLEPGLSGPCFCPARLTRVAINGPPSVIEGATASYWGTAFFDNGTSPAFTNSVWTTSNTNRFPITTNGILTAGGVTSNTLISVTAFFSYLGVVQNTNTPVTILNLPPPQMGHSLRLADRNFQFSIAGVTGRQHVVEATTNLAPPANWNALATNPIGPSGSLIFIDRTATNYPRRFYRVREL